VFNCSKIQIKTEENGYFAYLKDEVTNTQFEVSSDKFEIYFNTRENLAYLIDLTEQES
jgi:c-di-AMP phosphodiesterase-like protein